MGNLDDNFSGGWYSYRGSTVALNTQQPHKHERHEPNYLAEIVSRRDADAEPPWTGSRRVSGR